MKTKDRFDWLFLASSVLLVIIAFWLHLYRLPEVPYGIHIDEAGMAYDAWSLANYGTDRYNIKYPVYLLNFGMGQSALYAYMTMGLITFFDINMWTIRLPGALASLGMILAGSLFIRDYWHNRWAGLLGGLLLTIAPYFIMQSRFGLDCNLFVNFAVISLYLLSLAQNKKSFWLYVLAGLSWGITLYTYALSWLVVAFYLLLVGFFLIKYKQINLKQSIAFSFPLVLLATPLVIFAVINFFSLSQVELFGLTIPRLLLFRVNELSGHNLGTNFLTILQNSFFKDWLDYNAFDFFGPLYPISIPLCVLGFGLGTWTIIRQFRQKVLLSSGLVWLLFISVWLFGLFISGPNINKMNGIYFGWVFWLVWALAWLWQKVKFGRIFVMVVLFVYLILFGSFAKYYFTVYSSHIYPQYLFAGDFATGWAYVSNRFPTQTIYFEESYIYYLLGSRRPPINNDMYDFMVYSKQGRYHFMLPEYIDMEAVYIIRETNYHFQNRLKNIGFILDWSDEIYQVWKANEMTCLIK
ncbi:glycosyltransferase family 39 protein [Microgenomates group bacterium]|nr:glycosyltransferase family 39 protein [Microgenomates group bacterium]